MRVRMTARSAAFWLALACAGGAVADASFPPPPPAAADPLAAARKQIEARRWPAAIEELKRVNATGNADWNNLMGHAMRMQAQPDLDASQRYYEAALKINPEHAGALEYSGELALMRGDLATAQARLAALGRLCSSPCEPLDDLQKAIARFKATGKS